MQNRQREACRALARTLRASREGLASTLPASVRQLDENKQKSEESEENKGEILVEIFDFKFCPQRIDNRSTIMSQKLA